jgi:hypothetical protein
MFRFFYFLSTPKAMWLALIIAALTFCSCGTTSTRYTSTYNGGVYKSTNLGCAAYN